MAAQRKIFFVSAESCVTECMSYGRLRVCAAHVTISVKCSKATLQLKTSDHRSIGTGENLIHNHMKIINYCHYRSSRNPRERVMCDLETVTKDLLLMVNDIIAPRASEMLILRRMSTASRCMVSKLLFLIQYARCVLNARRYTSRASQ